MKRQENRLPVFLERFRLLQGKMSNTEFAKFLGVSRQTVGFYCNGDRLPDVITLLQIAEKCNVSTDYLLGRTDVKSSDEDIQVACETTGLSDDAISILQEYYASEALNVLLYERSFRDLLLSLFSYREAALAERIYTQILNGTASSDSLSAALNSVLKNSNLSEKFVDALKTCIALRSNNDIQISTFDSRFSAMDIYEAYANRCLTNLIDAMAGDAPILAKLLSDDIGLDLPLLDEIDTL